ncbi:MAG: tetratricopeptide repeat protein [Chloroflexi bacterium]|nr:tetratricopeptide repeat protein [Chloroflexota bacterium]
MMNNHIYKLIPCILAVLIIIFAAASCSPKFNPAEEYARGIKLLNEGKIAEAEAIFKKIVRYYPDNMDARIALGETYFKERLNEKAEKILRDAINEKPDLYQAYIALGKDYFKQLRLDEAEKAYFKALEINPNALEALAGLGHVYLERLDYKNSLKYFTKALKINPEYEKGLLGLGHISLDTGDPGKAEKYFKKVIELNPESGNGYKGLVAVNLYRRFYDDALRYSDKELTLDPECEFAHLERARIMMGLGRYDEAEKEMIAALKYNTSLENAYDYNVTMAEVYAMQGKDASAEQYLKHAIDLRKDPITAWTALGNLYAYRENSQEAEAAYSKALSLGPGVPQDEVGETHAAYALLLLSEDRKKESLEHIRQGEKLNPNNYWVLAARGRYLLKSGDLVNARKYLEKARETIPEIPQAWADLARSYFAEGKNLRALRVLTVAKNLEPLGREEVEYQIGIGYEKLGRIVEAEESYRNALKYNPNYKPALKKLNIQGSIQGK